MCAKVSNYVSSSDNNLVIVENASAGINAVLRSLAGSLFNSTHERMYPNVYIRLYSFDASSLCCRLCCVLSSTSRVYSSETFKLNRWTTVEVRRRDSPHGHRVSHGEERCILSVLYSRLQHRQHLHHFPHHKVLSSSIDLLFSW